MKTTLNGIIFTPNTTCILHFFVASHNVQFLHWGIREAGAERKEKIVYWKKGGIGENQKREQKCWINTDNSKADIIPENHFN